MLLAYHGVGSSEPDIRALLQTGARGTPARNLGRLSSFGFDAEVRTASMAELRQHLQEATPCLLFLHTGPLRYCPANAPHAVVAVGIDDQCVLIHDPELPLGGQSVPLPELAEAWSHTDYLMGVVTPGTKKQSRPLSPDH